MAGVSMALRCNLCGRKREVLLDRNQDPGFVWCKKCDQASPEDHPSKNKK